MNKSRSLFIFLLVACVAALILSIGLFADLAAQRKALSDTEKALETSMATWQQIAAEKEALQEDLALLKSDLREAELTLPTSVRTDAPADGRSPESMQKSPSRKTPFLRLHRLFFTFLL